MLDAFGAERIAWGTMRSVLVRLVQEGYVTSEVNREVRTRSFSVEEAADILEARVTLESALAGKAAERATEQDIRELRHTLEAMEEAQALGHQAEYSQGNRRFHQQVKDAAHQKTLARAYDGLLYPLVMRQYRNISAPPSAPWFVRGAPGHLSRHPDAQRRRGRRHDAPPRQLGAMATAPRIAAPDPKLP